MRRLIRLSMMVSVLMIGPVTTGLTNDADAAKPVEVQTKPPAIRVVEADKRQMTASLPANGTIAPRQEAVVGTNLSGLAILELLADEGDCVEKGDVLARLDTSSLDIQRIQAVAQRDSALASVAQSQSQVADARVAVSQAEDALGRQERLRKSGTVAEAALDNSRYALDSARAKLTTAERAVAAAQSQIAVSDAQIRDIDRRIADAEVTALASGLILERNATLGAVVGAGSSPLFRMAIDGQMELAAEVSETELATLAKGMKAKVVLPGRKEPIEGKIRIVDPEIDPVTRLGTVRIALPEVENLRAGAFARAEIETVDRETVAVPSTAILFDGRNPQLQKVVDDIIETTPVEIGVRSEGFVEVRQGVDAGDLIVSRAGTFVADGDRIRPIRETASLAETAQKTGSID